jgi:hypothetical protein
VLDNVIDYSNPATRAWLAAIVKGQGERGIHYFWTDFNSAGPPAKAHDATLVPGFEVPRAGMRTIRENLGENPVIGTYTSPTNVFLGLVDRVRVSRDMGDLSSLPTIVRDLAGCYFYHNRLWLNDPDPVFLKGGDNYKMAPNEPRIRVALGAVASSFLTTGDRIYDYTPEQQRMLTLLLPACGTAARPLDLMRRDVPEEFCTPVQTGWDRWLVLTYINLTNESRRYRVEPSRLGLKPDEPYLAFDFWPQKFIRVSQGEQAVDVPAMDTRCVLVRAVPAQPWVLSTDMHYQQGAVDLKDVAYDAASQTLHGTAVRHPGAEGVVTLFVPEGYRLRDASVPVAPAEAGQDARMVRLKLSFQAKDHPWSARFSR